MSYLHGLQAEASKQAWQEATTGLPRPPLLAPAPLWQWLLGTWVTHSCCPGLRAAPCTAEHNMGETPRQVGMASTASSGWRTPGHRSLIHLPRLPDLCQALLGICPTGSPGASHVPSTSMLLAALPARWSSTLQRGTRAWV